MATETHDAMYQTVGGAAGINKIVDLFYEKLWADPELQPYFAGIDRERLKHHVNDPGFVQPLRTMSQIGG